MQRSRSITSLNRGLIARCILHGITAHCETESSSRSGLPSVVDRSSAERKSSMISERTGSENRQAVKYQKCTGYRRFKLRFQYRR